MDTARLEGGGNQGQVLACSEKIGALQSVNIDQGLYINKA